MSELKLREFGAEAERLVALPDRSVLERRGQAVRTRRRAVGVAAVAAALVVAFATLRAIPDRHEEPVRPFPVKTQPYPGNHMKDLPAGTYELTPSAIRGEPTALITVSDGWNTWEGPNRFNGHVPGESNEQALDLYTWYVGALVVKVTAVADGPCDAGFSGGSFVDTYAETVAAIGHLPGYRRLATETTEAFGYPATYFDLRATADAESCKNGSILFLTSNNGSFGGESRVEIWVVRVDGVPLTVMASSGGDVPANIQAELDAVVGSIEFVVPEEWPEERAE
jgi:hypothetical protein